MTNARRYWNRLLRSLEEVFGDGFGWTPGTPDGVFYHEVMLRSEMLGRDGQRRDDHFFPQVHKLLENFPWFKLEQTTESIISAFDGLRPKLRDRILARRDLYEVLECLTPLTLYLFTQIPDIPDTQEEKASLLTIEGVALNSFAEKMAVLQPYTFDRKLPSAFQKAAAKEARISRVFSNTVGNSSAFIRFVSMWLVVQVFLAIAVPIFVVAMKTLKFDSTLIALLLGTPLAISAALTALPVNSRRAVDNPKQD